MNLIVLATAFVCLNGMRYKLNKEYLEKYAKDSGISMQMLIMGLVFQFIAVTFFLSSYWWASGRTVGFILELPSCIVGAYVSGRKSNPTPQEISFFNLQVIMTAIAIHFLLNR